MFYDTSSYMEKLVGTRDDRVHGIVVLLPSESKRLIARGASKGWSYTSIFPPGGNRRLMALATARTFGCPSSNCGSNSPASAL